jgi:hypothetical protein
MGELAVGGEKGGVCDTFPPLVKAGKVPFAEVAQRKREKLGAAKLSPQEPSGFLPSDERSLAVHF